MCRSDIQAIHRAMNRDVRYTDGRWPSIGRSSVELVPQAESLKICTTSTLVVAQNSIFGSGTATCENMVNPISRNRLIPSCPSCQSIFAVLTGTRTAAHSGTRMGCRICAGIRPGKESNMRWQLLIQNNLITVRTVQLTASLPMGYI